MNTSILVYRALIQPHFDYCSSVWDGLGETLSCELQKLQNWAVRVITKSSYNTSAGMLLDILRLNNLPSRRKKFKVGLVFRTLEGNTPSYLQDFFSNRGTGYNLRNSQVKNYI